MAVARARPLPPDRQQSYLVDTPEATHWRPATCEEVRCKPYLEGWTTSLNPATQAAQVAAVRRSGRRPSAVAHVAGMVVFTFEAGTPCFAAASHRVRLDRPELYIVHGGNWRTNTGVIRRHTRPELFVEDMHEQTDAAIRRL